MNRPCFLSFQAKEITCRKMQDHNRFLPSHSENTYRQLTSSSKWLRTCSLGFDSAFWYPTQWWSSSLFFSSSVTSLLLSTLLILSLHQWHFSIYIRLPGKMYRIPPHNCSKEMLAVLWCRHQRVFHVSNVVISYFEPQEKCNWIWNNSEMLVPKGHFKMILCLCSAVLT